jgi:hypothetical protein
VLRTELGEHEDRLQLPLAFILSPSGEKITRVGFLDTTLTLVSFSLFHLERRGEGAIGE